MRTLKEEKKARDEFEQLLSDDSDFKNLWGLENDDNYDEFDFQEWYQEHYQNLKSYKARIKEHLYKDFIKWFNKNYEGVSEVEEKHIKKYLGYFGINNRGNIEYK